MKLEYLVFEDEIIIFWEKEEQAAPSDRYRITVNGQDVRETVKTHCRLEELAPDTDYCVRVSRMRGETEESSAEERLRTAAKRERLNVAEAPYCAAGDGKTLNTAALQKALDDCKKGQTVYIPAGVFLTGALRLHSDMELYLEEGAVLLGTEDPKDYLPFIRSRFEGIEMECYSSLLNLGEMDHTAGPGYGHVAIRGKGTICGGGQNLGLTIIEQQKKKQEEYLASLGEAIREFENENTVPGRVRPRLINISNSRGICICGVTLKDGPSWNVHMLYSDSIWTCYCRFVTRGVWNGDGWDPDSSTNCTLFGCSFDTGDDAVAIKSGKNPEGNKIARPCAHIRVFDCYIEYGHGFAIGSEISGGIEDVKIWDCDLHTSFYGIQIKSTPKRGGYVRGVRIWDCVTSAIQVHTVEYNDDGEPAETIPIVEDIAVDHITVRK